MSEDIVVFEERDAVEKKIISNVASLEKVFDIHRSLMRRNIEAPHWYPQELKPYVNVDKTFPLWEDQRYEEIRDYYAQLWIDFYAMIYESDPVMTVSEAVAQAQDVELD